MTLLAPSVSFASKLYAILPRNQHTNIWCFGGAWGYVIRVSVECNRKYTGRCWSRKRNTQRIITETSYSVKAKVLGLLGYSKLYRTEDERISYLNATLMLFESFQAVPLRPWQVVLWSLASQSAQWKWRTYPLVGIYGINFLVLPEFIRNCISHHRRLAGSSKRPTGLWALFSTDLWWWWGNSEFWLDPWLD